MSCYGCKHLRISDYSDWAHEIVFRDCDKFNIRCEEVQNEYCNEPFTPEELKIKELEESLIELKYKILSLEKKNGYDLYIWKLKYNFKKLRDEIKNTEHFETLERQRQNAIAWDTIGELGITY